ncbi:HD domain-containing phosphohydrolase [Elusimicrobiota bacterium]
MKKSIIYISLYRLIGSEKSFNEFLQDMLRLLKENFSGTEWNMGVVKESTAQLRFEKAGALFDSIIPALEKAFSEKKEIFSKKDVPGKYGWFIGEPVYYEGQQLGVLACLGKGKKKPEIKKIADVIGFVIQQYRLKTKLINDTILMNSIIMSSQQTSFATEIDPLVEMLLPQLKKYLAVDNMRLYMWEGEESFYYDENGKRVNYSFPDRKSIVRSVKNKGRALMLNDAYKKAEYDQEIDGMDSEENCLNLILMPIKVENEVKGVLTVSNNDPDCMFVGSELIWARTTCGEIGATMERLKLYKDIHELFMSSVEAMAVAIDCKDPYTHGHSRRVAMYSMMIGKDIGMSNEEIENIRLSALLHDIGKIAVPEAILLKTSKLTDDEWKILKDHPAGGVKILRPIKKFDILLSGIKHHHERYDGNGYPDGIKGEKIPLIARVIAIADSFDAMSSTRVYRGALTEEEALKEIARCRGTQFDPELADAFVRIYKEKLLGNV